jgi:ABC-type multidrug transport system fused ATPase/permease subunit
VLSPAEWSKLILSKVIAQTVFDNDNAAASNDRVENSLIGSVLLLDDPTVLLSEVEEAKFLKELRGTGAATIVTSNKWAAGRFGDHIAVVKDGAIVEFGTHNELLARGPQQSLYAAKWQAMTMVQ